ELTMPLRAAVIGRTGRGDYGHGLDVALLDQPGVEVVAVADEDPAGLAAAAKRLKVDRAYADYRKRLDSEKPSPGAVCPPWLDGHREMVVACAERGAHVFCEKPLAPTPADCDAIVEACEGAHVKCAVAFQTRYSARFDRVKELIADGAIGEVLELRGRGKEDRRGGGEGLLGRGTHGRGATGGLMGGARWGCATVTEGRPGSGPEERRGGA